MKKPKNIRRQPSGDTIPGTVKIKDKYPIYGKIEGQPTREVFVPKSDGGHEIVRIPVPREDGWRDPKSTPTR